MNRLLCRLGFHKWGRWRDVFEVAPNVHHSTRFCKRGDCCFVQSRTVDRNRP